jgi:hypothetical protein
MGEAQKYRIICDCSFYRGQDVSVNSGIDAGDFAFVLLRFDTFVDWVVASGPGACMWKEDMKDAYRLVPVRSEDWPLLGRAWDRWDNSGRTFYLNDMVLPFGVSSSAGIFNCFAEAVQELAKILRPNSFIGHYLDDAAGVGPKCHCGDDSKHHCVAALDHHAYKMVCEQFGIPLNDKGGLFGHEMKFLGIVINTQLQSLTLPPEKLAKVRAVVGAWVACPEGTKRELARLVGVLGHAARVVRWGRSFVRRLIDDMQGFLHGMGLEEG